MPFQLLLLLEKMQDSRQKAVRPMELVYCLQKHSVPGETAPRTGSWPGSLVGGRGRPGGRGRRGKESRGTQCDVWWMVDPLYWGH